MLKYLDSQIYTKEIPDEIALGISITGCPIHCPECHSKHTWDANKGKILTPPELMKLIYPNHRLISCIFFYGGEWDSEWLISLINFIKNHNFPHKIGLYSGNTFEWFLNNSVPLLKVLDYLKTGPYISRFGPLNNINTNQRMYKLKEGKIDEDITKIFRRMTKIKQEFEI